MTLAEFSRRGFSLVELMIVMVIIAVLAAGVLLSGSSTDTVSAYGEARKLEATLKTLRSAWLACYADTYRMPGVPGNNTYELSSDVAATLARYADRSLAEDIAAYGNIRVATSSLNADDAIYIGFVGPWRVDSAAIKSDMKRMIAQGGLKLYAGVAPGPFEASGGDEILIRIR